MKQARDHVTVATVVTDAARDANMARSGPASPQQGQRRGTGALHQIDGGNAIFFDRETVHLTNLETAIEGMG